MLALESHRWSGLQHAYGMAGDIPGLLRQLEAMPAAVDEQEPWHSLWSSLAHQGDVYAASFAAVPHVVRALASAPRIADAVYFHFPAWVEICRVRKSVRVPEELNSAYFEAISRLPSLVAAAAARDWDADFLSCALCAIAAAKGHVAVAEAVLELSPEMTEEFMEWMLSR